ncbi:MAG: flagellar biosynthesis protein FliQ [Oscillospiraceae bacterium]
MTQGQMLDIMKEALIVCLKLSGPFLLGSILVGLVISIFQAATQIHEQTLTFVPKILLLAIMLLGLGSWMAMVMSEFCMRLFTLMATL